MMVGTELFVAELVGVERVGVGLTVTAGVCCLLLSNTHVAVPITPIVPTTMAPLSKVRRGTASSSC